MALETGDTGCFLSVVHANSGPEAGGTQGTSSKKRRGSCSSSLTDSTNTAAQRASYRESDFSVGDDSTLEMALNTDEFMLPQMPPQVQQQHQSARQMAAYQQQQRAPSAAYGAVSNSLRSGVHPPPMQAGGGSVSSMVHNHGRRSVNYSSTSSNFNYQPITQSGVNGSHHRGGRHGLSASWHAGSTFAQHDFDFPSPFSFNATSTNTDTVDSLVHQGGMNGRQQLQEIGEPIPLNDNGNVDMLERLISMGQQQQESIQEVEEQGKELSSEDVELASFFEKFAESLQK